MMTITNVTLLAILAATLSGGVQGFVSPQGRFSLPSTAEVSLRSTTSSEVSYEPVFDFADPTKEAVASFDRIDDAIMGGISTSSIRAIASGDESYASWSGVCRTDGGGFCGTRTLPFQDGKPLQVSDATQSADGFYLKLRLNSDNEPERRIWKLTTRVENESRSEQLYQSEFEIPKQSGDDSKEWQTIRVPFDSFRQVRGPRLIQNGPPLDVRGGLFQIGLTLSKFQMAANMTTLDNFRPGYFEVQLQEIGVYTSKAAAAASSTTLFETPKTLTKKEADQKKPLLLKILGPVFKVIFSEQKNRQKSAVRILKKRGMGRFAIARYGFQRKVANKGLIVGVLQSLVDGLSAVAGFAALWALKLAIFYPLVAIRRTMKLLKGKTTKKSSPPPQPAA